MLPIIVDRSQCTQLFLALRAPRGMSTMIVHCSTIYLLVKARSKRQVAELFAKPVEAGLVQYITGRRAVAFGLDHTRIAQDFEML